MHSPQRSQDGRISRRLVGRKPATYFSPTKTVGTIRMPFLISSSSRAGCSVVFFSRYLMPLSDRRVLYSATGCPLCAKDRKSTRLNSSHLVISYAVFCLKKKTRYV